MKIEEELNNLMSLTKDSNSHGLTADLVVLCNGNAPEVLERCKDVLKKVIGSELSYEDSVDDWSALLPEWFVEACADEISREEADKILATPEGFAILANRWTVKGFIDWFRPEDRSWFWWNGKVKDSNTLMIQLVVYGFPFAWGALEFLLKASGANEVEELH